MNSITVAGNIGKDAEERQAGGDTVVSFSVADSRKIKGQDVTIWFRVSLWGKRGSALLPYLQRGQAVTVVGELSTREHDGRTYLEIRASDVKLQGGGKRDVAGHDAAQPPRQRRAQQADAEAWGGGGSDDLPF